MTRFLLLFSLLITTTVGAWAQADSRPGYIVPLSGDTVRGQVSYLSGQRSARQCIFKPAGASTTTTYGPQQLTAYGRGDEQFESSTVTILEEAPAPRFLVLTERGPVRLYLLVTEGSRERFFIRAQGGPLVELTQQTERRDGPSGVVVETDRRYRAALARAFRDCPDALRQSQQTDFNLIALRRAVRRYNACGQAAPTRPAAPGGGIRVSAVLGLPAYHVLRLGNGNDRVVGNDKLTGKAYLTAGLLVAVNSKLHDPRVSFLTGVFYEANRRYTVHKQYASLAYNPLYKYTDTDVAFSYLKVPLLVRYTWPSGSVQPYVEAGGTLRTLLSMSHNVTTNTYEYPYSTDTGPLLVGRQRLAPGGWLGAGLKLGRPERRQLLLGAQGEVANGPILASPVQNGDNSTRFFFVNVLLGYDLTK